MGTNPFRRKGLIKENTLDGSAVDALPERTEARILPIVTGQLHDEIDAD